jgi:hypothetical protein
MEALFSETNMVGESFRVVKLVQPKKAQEAMEKTFVLEKSIKKVIM